VQKVVLCAPHELGETEVNLWHRFQAEDPRLANPFLSPEFAQVLGRHRDDVWIAVIEEGSRIVGFLPHHRSRHGVGRSLAHGHGHSLREGFVTASDYPLESAAALERCGLKVLDFDNLPAYQAELLRLRVTSSLPTYLVDLTPGWAAWSQKKRASSTAKKTLQNQRKLAREIGEVTFSFDDTRPEALQQLISWKSDQYRRTGRLDQFSLPWFVDMVTELTATSTPQFTGRLSVLSVDGRPIAAQQALAAHGVIACWFTAYDGRMAAYSPGMACELELVHAAADLGMREIDLGPGMAHYKDALKDGERSLVRGWIERPSPAAALRRIQREAYEFANDRPMMKKIAIDLTYVRRRRLAAPGVSPRRRQVRR
jgi:CelD/BcsL family acetyltransferase involved in cellulose biosynthesis